MPGPENLPSHLLFAEQDSLAKHHRALQKNTVTTDDDRGERFCWSSLWLAKRWRCRILNWTNARGEHKRLIFLLSSLFAAASSPRVTRFCPVILFSPSECCRGVWTSHLTTFLAWLARDDSRKCQLLRAEPRLNHAARTLWGSAEVHVFWNYKHFFCIGAFSPRWHSLTSLNKWLRGRSNTNVYPGVQPAPPLPCKA